MTVATPEVESVCRLHLRSQVCEARFASCDVANQWYPRGNLRQLELPLKARLGLTLPPRHTCNVLFLTSSDRDLLAGIHSSGFRAHPK